VEVFLGEQKAEVLFAGLAPGFPGVYQINVRVPTLWTDRLYLRQQGWLSNVVQIDVRAQNNSANVTATLTPVFPSADYRMASSFAFLAAKFQFELDVRSGAKSFLVAAVGEAGGSFTRIDPVNGMYKTYTTSPTGAAAKGDFSVVPWPLIDFSAGCQPFPGNIIPLAKLDPGYVQFVSYELTQPDVLFPQFAAGTSEYADGLAPGVRFSASGAFADFLRIPCGSLKNRKTTFTLYVDGKAVTSQDVTFPIAGR
jgi:hypothetical protein